MTPSWRQLGQARSPLWALPPLPSPHSHLPTYWPRGGATELAAEGSATRAPAGNSPPSMSERLKLCRWPSLNTMTMVPELFLEDGGAADAAETAKGRLPPTRRYR